MVAVFGLRLCHPLRRRSASKNHKQFKKVVESPVKVGSVDQRRAVSPRPMEMFSASKSRRSMGTNKFKSIRQGIQKLDSNGGCNKCGKGLQHMTLFDDEDEEKKAATSKTPLQSAKSRVVLSKLLFLKEQRVKAVELARCDWIHVDVMDGRFVPNITIGPFVVDALRPVTDLPLDVHLMIGEPEQRIPDFVKAEADIVSVHCEQSSMIHLHLTIQRPTDESTSRAMEQITQGYLLQLLLLQLVLDTYRLGDEMCILESDARVEVCQAVIRDVSDGHAVDEVLEDQKILGSRNR